MSLDIYLSAVRKTTVFDTNITHNLNEMAKAAGIYQYLWRPDELGIINAGQLIEPLKAGLKELKNDPEKYKAYDSPNGWGTYNDFVPWLQEYILACEEYPDAEIDVSR